MILSLLSTVDTSCLLCASLFFFANLLSIIHRAIEYSQMSSEDYQTMLSLDPAFLQNAWTWRSKYVGLKTSAGMFNALAWFTFIIPVLQTAWILSKGGKRHLGLHIFLAGVVVAGGIIESVSRLMIIGVDSVSHWMASDFNLSSWNYRNDGIGWRVLEMVYQTCNGIIVWIDAFEWLALSGVLIIIYASVDSEKNEESVGRTFNLTWAHCGVVIGTFCWFDFLAAVMRMENLKMFQSWTILISAMNMLILLPIWIIMLGKQLTEIKPVFYDIAVDTAATQNNSSAEPAEMEMDEFRRSQRDLLHQSTPSDLNDDESHASSTVFEIS